MTAEELLKKVRLIEFKSKRKINSLFLGEYHSSFKGVGMTFSEVRQYQYGDDVRKIDWNKTARFNEPFVKIFEEEREMISMILIDISASMNFGTRKQFKNDTVAEISATLAFSAIKNNDKVGLILYSDKIESFIPPKKGNSHVVRMIKEILETEPKPAQTNLNLVFDFLLKTIKRKSNIFLISDFDIPNFERSLSIVTKKHDITGIRVYDDIEKIFPNIGLVKFKDLETGKIQWINTSSSKIREEYSKYYAMLVTRVENTFTKNGAGFLNIPTQGDYIKVLFNYFKGHH
ncbi:DUF58 domain-containing protein [Apibacter adventoris]|uniref:DUF58 domain-containing protein n=1 Tax=Apibacter adventoris TaxID=1679466 RepID=A0A2S8AFY3_9FLAO|nr:DUF58 domain-containing protein [Apibacter adventoris]PQL95026.1 DUF58 domain-containing protein [Apibacter adventoris]